MPASKIKVMGLSKLQRMHRAKTKARKETMSQPGPNTPAESIAHWAQQVDPDVFKRPLDASKVVIPSTYED